MTGTKMCFSQRMHAGKSMETVEAVSCQGSEAETGNQEGAFILAWPGPVWLAQQDTQDAPDEGTQEEACHSAAAQV